MGDSKVPRNEDNVLKKPGLNDEGRTEKEKCKRSVAKRKATTAAIPHFDRARIGVRAETTGGTENPGRVEKWGIKKTELSPKRIIHAADEIVRHKRKTI